MPDLGFDDLQETITIVHPTTVDEWGDPDTQGSGATTETVTGALFQPGATRENEVSANTVQADGTLYIDPDLGLTIGAQDRVVIRGETYEVVGRPRAWLNTLIEIPVRVVTG